ncbi:hypothetical protein AURDEDRAFT_61787 [Auricularia subglabra TFB-10046 SS5]|nr:hypothetical protein AURDEDRAFT_61787 [Auricularia subglabra TFB-10046 SS5]
MAPCNARYFAFDPPPGSTESLNTKAALDQLLASGCKHATQQWVENHFGLILWKLSGMIANDADPYDALMKRWNWAEVMAQLNYRYKREYVDGARPALRAVLERDAHAGAPMVLCVSAIEWTPAQKNADGSTTEASAVLELTDGWYFVRATVDAAILRGIKLGTIKVGRKIACAGAKVSRNHHRWDVFSAYNSSALVLSGNGSAMAPWHAKLGFHRQGFTACLRSLTPDGGMVPFVDVVVVKAYPTAFYETLPDGSRAGPWNEAEEREAQDRWSVLREREHQKLVQEFERQAFAAETLLDKLKRAAGKGFSPGSDGESLDTSCMPDHIEDLCEELAEDPNAGARLKSISSRDAGWMAVYLQGKLEKDKERLAFDIEGELAAACPARSVRSFRVVRVRDTHSARRPATRTAQLTVWDASQLGKDMLVSGARLQVRAFVPSFSP